MLADRDAKGRPKNRLESLLRDPVTSKKTKRGSSEFAPLAGSRPIIKMKVPDSGIW